MKYSIKAIPTTYAGVNFRSRLEARWAAFFDLCGWDWDYEPFDLAGWAPDFMLKGKVKALVEVKPIDFRGADTLLARQAKSDAQKAFDCADKVETSRSYQGELPDYEIIIVGNGPFKSTNYDNWSLGVFALDTWFGDDVADLYWADKSSDRLDYAARFGSYQYRISGKLEGDHHKIHIADDHPKHLWREAGNIVQWQPERERRHDAAYDLTPQAVVDRIMERRRAA